MWLRGSNAKAKSSPNLVSSIEVRDENGNTMSANSKNVDGSTSKVHNTRGRASEPSTSGNNLKTELSPSSNGEKAMLAENGGVENESRLSGNGLEVEPLPSVIVIKNKPGSSGQSVSDFPVKRIMTRKITRTLKSESVTSSRRLSPRSNKRELPSAPKPNKVEEKKNIVPPQCHVLRSLRKSLAAVPPVLEKDNEQVPSSSRTRGSMPNLKLEATGPQLRIRPNVTTKVDSKTVNQIDQTLSSAVSLVLGKKVNVSAAKSLYPNPEFRGKDSRKSANGLERDEQPSTSPNSNKRLKREPCASTSTAAFSEDIKPDVEMLKNPAFEASPEVKQNGSGAPRVFREYIPRPSRSRSVKIKVETISPSSSLEELPQDNQNGEIEMLNVEDEAEIASTSIAKRLKAESSRTASPVDIKPDLEELEKLVNEATPKPSGSGSLRRSTRLNESLMAPQTSQEFMPRATRSRSSSAVVVKVESVSPPPPQENIGENDEAEVVVIDPDVVVKTEPESEESSVLDSNITVKTEQEPGNVQVDEEEEVEYLNEEEEIAYFQEEERTFQELIKQETKMQLRSTKSQATSHTKTVPIATASRNAARNTMKSLKRALKTVRVRKPLKLEPVPEVKKRAPKTKRPTKMSYVHDVQLSPPGESNAAAAVEIIEENDVDDQYRVPNYTEEEKTRLYGDKQFVMDVKDVDKDPSNMYIWQILAAQCCLRRYSPCRFGQQQFHCSSPQRWFFAEEEFRGEEFCRRFQPLAINTAKLDVHFAPGWEMEECIIQYPYVDKDFFFRMTKNLGRIGETAELRWELMKSMPLMILQNFNPSAIPELLAHKKADEKSLAKDLLSYINAWIKLQDAIDVVLREAETSKKFNFKEGAIKLLKTFPSLYYMPLKMKNTPHCTICFPAQKKEATFKVVLTSKLTNSNGPKPYDPQTLQDIPDGVAMTNRQNVKEFWCDECSTAAQKYHRLAHFCYSLYRLLRQNMAGDLAIFKAENIPITDKFVLWMHDVDVNWRYTMFLDLQLTIAEVQAEFQC